MTRETKNGNPSTFLMTDNPGWLNLTRYCPVCHGRRDQIWSFSVLIKYQRWIQAWSTQTGEKLFFSQRVSLWKRQFPDLMISKAQTFAKIFTTNKIEMSLCKQLLICCVIFLVVNELLMSSQKTSIFKIVDILIFNDKLRTVYNFLS